MFRMSGLDMVVDEVDRLWRKSEPYRTFSRLQDASGRRRIVREHAKMITALRRRDNAGLVELMNAHRDQTIAEVSAAMGLALTPSDRPAAE